MGRPKKTQPSDTDSNTPPEPELEPQDAPSPEIQKTSEKETTKLETVKSKESIKDIPAILKQPANFNLQSRPNRRRTESNGATLPIVTAKVYVLAAIKTRGGKINHFPLHEIPLLRRKVRMQMPGSSVEVLAEWPDVPMPRERFLNAQQLRDEYDRLVGWYKFTRPGGRDSDEVNLVSDLYGNGLGGLRDAMTRLYRGWKQIQSSLGVDEQLSDEQMDELVKLADPDFELDMTSVNPFTKEFDVLDGPGAEIDGVVRAMS